MRNPATVGLNSKATSKLLSRQQHDDPHILASSKTLRNPCFFQTLTVLKTRPPSGPGLGAGKRAAVLRVSTRSFGKWCRILAPGSGPQNPKNVELGAPTLLHTFSLTMLEKLQIKCQIAPLARTPSADSIRFKWTNNLMLANAPPDA